MAKDIFEGIKNSSSLSSSSGDDDVADISASIGIMKVMAQASENIVLDEDVFPVSSFNVNIFSTTLRISSVTRELMYIA